MEYPKGPRDLASHSRPLNCPRPHSLQGLGFSSHFYSVRDTVSFQQIPLGNFNQSYLFSATQQTGELITYGSLLLRGKLGILTQDIKLQNSTSSICSADSFVLSQSSHSSFLEQQVFAVFYSSAKGLGHFVTSITISQYQVCLCGFFS